MTGDRLLADPAGRAVGWFYSRARRVYVPTKITGRGLMEQGVGPSRLFIFGRGVGTHTFESAHRNWNLRRRMGGESAEVVLYVGRISRQKGLDLPADAFRLAAAARPELELVIVGERPYRQVLTARVTLSAAYASADPFCLPSRTETFGQVVLEAAASGLPVIVTDQGGAHESVVDGETGVIVPADDPRTLAAALVGLARDPARRQRLGRHARQQASRRSGWPELFSQLVASYADVHHRPARGRNPGVTGTQAPIAPQ